METIKKIYLHPDIGDREFIKPWLRKAFNDDSVEYVRTDIIIDEIWEWLNKNAGKYMFDDERDCPYELLEEFQTHFITKNGRLNDDE